MVSLTFFLVDIDLISISTSFILSWAIILPKMNIDCEIFKCSLLTNSFELEDGLWIFVKIRRHRWRLSGHLHYLIRICRWNSWSKLSGHFLCLTRICRWHPWSKLSGHLLYLIRICRRHSKSKFFILTRMVSVVCTCYKWAGIGVWVGDASLCLLFILES
jgi:hypothetical protein